MRSTQVLVQAALRNIESGAYGEIALAIMDMGGHPLLTWRPEEIGFFYSDLAAGKAWTAVALRRSPNLTAASLAERPAVAAYLSGLGRGSFAPIEGGALLLSDGTPLCGLGIAGPASGNVDIALARELAISVGLEVHDGSAHAWMQPNR